MHHETPLAPCIYLNENFLYDVYRLYIKTKSICQKSPKLFNEISETDINRHIKNWTHPFVLS